MLYKNDSVRTGVRPVPLAQSGSDRDPGFVIGLCNMHAPDGRRCNTQVSLLYACMPTTCRR